MTFPATHLGRPLPSPGTASTRRPSTSVDIGRHEISVAEGCTLGLYDPIRSIIDAFRLRHLAGHEQATEALRRWLRSRGSQPSDLLEMARRFPKAESSIRTVLQVLA